jgi:hypothetical protein
MHKNTFNSPLSRRKFLSRTVAVTSGVLLSPLALDACSSDSTKQTSIDVADVSHLSSQQQLLFSALQGIANKTGPNIYLLGLDGSEPGANVTESLWLKEIVPLEPNFLSIEALLQKYIRLVDGLILWDSRLAIHTQNLATTLAGVYNYLPVSAQLANWNLLSKFNLKVKIDLSKRNFKNGIAAYTWLLNRKQSNQIQILGPPVWIGNILNTSTPRTSLRDWIVSESGFAFELYVETLSDLIFLPKLLSFFPNNSTVYGYLYYDDAVYRKTGIAFNEYTAVSTLSKSNKALVASSNATNLSVYSKINSPYIKPKWVNSKTPVSDNTTFISFGFTDGDNVGYNLQHLRKYLWDDPLRGSFPMSFSISPYLVKLAPGAYSYYTRSMTENENLIMGPSGAGYVYPSDLKNLSQYLKTTKSLMDLTGLDAIWILDNNTIYPPSSSMLDAYVSELNPTAIVSLYGGFPNAAAYQPAAFLYKGIPILNSVRGIGVNATTEAILTTNQLELNNFRNGLKFQFVALDAWSMTYNDAQSIMKNLGESYKAVTLSTMSKLMATYNLKDLSKKH